MRPIKIEDIFRKREKIEEVNRKRESRLAVKLAKKRQKMLKRAAVQDNKMLAKTVMGYLKAGQYFPKNENESRQCIHIAIMGENAKQINHPEQFDTSKGVSVNTKDTYRYLLKVFPDLKDKYDLLIQIWVPNKWTNDIQNDIFELNTSTLRKEI